MPKLIYIAGPYRKDKEAAVRAFQAAGKQIILCGDYLPLDPISNTHHLDGVIEEDDFIERDLEMVRRCDGVFALAGWEQSAGASKEVGLATFMELPVFFDVGDLRTYDWSADPTYEKRIEVHPMDNPPAPSEPTEVILTDPTTGARKASKMARFDLLPMEPLWLCAEHYGKGAIKYDDNNWRKGYAWSWSFRAMMRHAWAFWGGEDTDVIDKEKNLTSPHLCAVVFHALALLEFAKTHPELDDRYTKGVPHGTQQVPAPADN